MSTLHFTRQSTAVEKEARLTRDYPVYIGNPESEPATRGSERIGDSEQTGMLMPPAGAAAHASVDSRAPLFFRVLI